jgi:hypothetical protein
MDFIDYLIDIKELSSTSASEYNNRLTYLKEFKIYKGEKFIDDQMLVRIKSIYKNTTKEHLRTIKYHIEFLNYSNEFNKNANHF